MGKGSSGVFRAQVDTQSLSSLVWPCCEQEVGLESSD